MDLKKQLHLKALKKQYGYDIAVLKTSPEHRDLDDENLYKSLLIYELQNKLTDTINEYAEAVDFSPQELSSLVSVLLNATGEILSNVARHDPEFVVLCRDIAINLFEQHIKDFLNGKPTKHS